MFKSEEVIYYIVSSKCAYFYSQVLIESLIDFFLFKLKKSQRSLHCSSSNRLEIYEVELPLGVGSIPWHIKNFKP